MLMAMSENLVLNLKFDCWIVLASVKWIYRLDSDLPKQISLYKFFFVSGLIISLPRLCEVRERKLYGIMGLRK